MSNYLTLDELGCESSYDVPRAWIGEDGDAIAITTDVRRGLAAIHAMARADLGKPACTSRVTTGWAWFTAGSDGAEVEWAGHFCGEEHPAALPVVVAHEVGEVS